MKPFRVALLAVVFACMAAGGTSNVEAAPAPSFNATLVDDGQCLFTVMATWKNAKVDHVYTFLYLNDAYLLTLEAPGTGPNAGTLRGRTAVLMAGPFASASSSNNWSALVQYYSGGAFAAQTYTNVDMVPCAVGP